MKHRPLSSICSVALALAVSSTLACGGGGDDGNGDDCTNSTLTYANFGEQFFTDYCTACHSPGAAQRAAPDLDTLENVQASAARVDLRAGTGLSMPPLDPRPATEERALLAEWISCGAE